MREKKRDPFHHRMVPQIIRTLQDSSAYLVRGAMPTSFVDKAHALATGFPEKAWHRIHSRTDEDVHRVVAMVADQHATEMKMHGEYECISQDTETIELAQKFASLIAVAARACNKDWSPVTEVDFIRVKAWALGQRAHMDSFHNGWGFVLCLADGSSITHLKNYTCFDFPENLHNTPRNWKNLPTVTWQWSRGDVLVFKTNRIHEGPPNPSACNRYVLFGSTDITDSTGVATFSDSSTIFEDIFFGVISTHTHTGQAPPTHTIPRVNAILLLACMRCVHRPPTPQRWTHSETT